MFKKFIDCFKYDKFVILIIKKEKLFEGDHMNVIKKKVEFYLLVCIVFVMMLLPAENNVNGSSVQNLPPFHLLNNGCSVNPPSVEWNKTFGGSQWDTLYCVQGTTDGGCVAVGVYTYTDDLNHAWILKLDAAGNEEWSIIETTELYGMNFLMTFVQQTRDKGYIVAGYVFKTIEQSEEQYDVGMLWKVNSTGSTEWIHWYLQDEEPIIIVPWVVYEVEDGYIATGYVTYTNKTQNIMLMKTNKTGDIEWKKIYTFWNGASTGKSLCFTNDEGFLIAGGAKNDLCLVKTDVNGNPEWYHTYGGSRIEYAFSRNCFQASDGGYLFNGMTSSYGAGNLDVWVVQTDATGNMQWTKTYGEKTAESCLTLEKTFDGGYIFAATKNYGSASGTRDDFWIVRLDSNGYAHWYLTIGGPKEDRAYYISKTMDGGYIVSGRTNSYGAGDCDGWLIKIAPDPGLPNLDIDINGGLGINMVLTNNGSLDATSVPWQINVKGGMRGLVNKTISGTIDVAAGESKTISTGFLFGLGNLQITGKVYEKTKTAGGTQFFILTFLKK